MKTETTAETLHLLSVLRKLTMTGLKKKFLNIS